MAKKKKQKLVPMSDVHQHTRERLKNQQAKRAKLIRQYAKLRAQQMMANGLRTDAMNQLTDNEATEGSFSALER